MMIAIIQARMSSTRLPEKVMKEIEGRPLLWHVVNRVKQSKTVEDIIIATGEEGKNEPIIRLAEDLGLKYFSGSEEDVLDRFYQTARKYGANVIVRITSDCPLVDPKIIDRIVGFYLENGFDYVSNTLKPTYPDGLDVEVFSFKAMQRAWKESKLPSEREHVTPYIIKNPQIFGLKNFENEDDLSFHRWTVDEERDLEFVREIYKRLNGIFYMDDVLNLMEKHPELKEINKEIPRNEGYIKSLKEDNGT